MEQVFDFMPRIVFAVIVFLYLVVFKFLLLDRDELERLLRKLPWNGKIIEQSLRELENGTG